MNLKLLKIVRFFHLINKKNYNEKRQIEIVKKSPLFDAKWYLAQNPDVKAQKIGAAKHYVKYGWKEGRNPSPDFDTEEYLHEYPELEEKNWCPLAHWEKYKRKKRKIICRGDKNMWNSLSQRGKLPKIIIMPEYCAPDILTSCANIRLKFPYCYEKVQEHFDVELQAYNKRSLPIPGSGKIFVIQRQATSIDIKEFKIWKKSGKRMGD